MDKKNILISGVVGIASLIGGFVLGHYTAKKRYSPKKTSGEIYIDHTENPEKPSIYLGSISPDLFINMDGYIIFGLKHIRK